MKIVIFIISLVFGIGFGLVPKNFKKKPLHWKIITSVFCLFAVSINLLIPLEEAGVAQSDFFTYPNIQSLGEWIRMMNFHVPLAWVAVLAYLLSMIYSVQYLRTQKIENDGIASSSALLGTIFAVAATVTGMFWAKVNWGAYWNWDPRETSIFILLLIYFAYFALRANIDNPLSKAKLSSVYSIFSFVTVPFLVFVLPRIAKGLHPGSGDDINSGPIVTTKQSMLDNSMALVFGLSLAAATLLYFWLLSYLVEKNNSALIRRKNERK